jgi:uncharacterized LabA/DUF88 family protein
LTKSNVTVKFLCVTPRGRLDQLFSDLAEPLGFFFLMELKTAILVDGSFFIQRVDFFQRKFFSSQPNFTAAQYIEILQALIKRHLYDNNHRHYLYRTFYYDSAPLDLNIHKPLVEAGETNKRIEYFGRKPENKCRVEFLELLRTQRKVALRLGEIKHQKTWKIKDKVISELLEGGREVKDLTNDDFYFESKQKGVDIKLGLDIASLSYEKLVDQIVLIAGDSDFVPAAKLARMKGIDFVLDCLKNNIDPALNEHIDGLNSYDLVSIIQTVLKVDPDTKPSWWTEAKPPQKNRTPKTRNRRR